MFEVIDPSLTFELVASSSKNIFRNTLCPMRDFETAAQWDLTLNTPHPITKRTQAT
jgi:hypothetical protein